ncbi:MAG: hypothetical protein HC831_25625 [Chloroflexia bacterium]|nr:hypothetical protein [Chloroflexia bacterium]
MMQQEKMYALVEQWESSGLSKKEFSLKEGVSYDSFLYWAQKYNREINLAKRSSCSREIFVPLQVEYPVNMQEQPVEITYPNGVKLACSPSVSLEQLHRLIHFF